MLQTPMLHARVVSTSTTGSVDLYLQLSDLSTQIVP